jgi:hypothetical protein
MPNKQENIVQSQAILVLLYEVDKSLEKVLRHCTEDRDFEERDRLLRKLDENISKVMKLNRTHWKANRPHSMYPREHEMLHGKDN